MFFERGVRVSGPSAVLPSLLKRLDPRTLADLTADLLAVRGHTNIKITDGPGDGGRDIHSRDRRGRLHLVQCKHRASANSTVSSRDIGELPSAMVKLGYKGGLFVTNGRISPQSKREFLDNYKELSLDFLDGAELAGETVRDPVLRAVWFDGTRIERISNAIGFAVLLRDLERDKPLSLATFVARGQLVRRQRGEGVEKVGFRFQLAHVPSGSFASYRPPGVKTLDEGWWPDIKVGEFILTGVRRLSEIQFLRRVLARRILAQFARSNKTSDKASSKHLALRVARPSLTSLAGEQVGTRTELKSAPFTLVSHNGVMTAEREWLRPSVGPTWYPPDRLTAVTANWVRWYNPEDDVCLDLNLISIPSEHGRGTVAEQVAFERKRWNGSIFALIPAERREAMRLAGIPAPTETFSWCSAQILCSWFIDSGSPFRAMLVEPPDEDGDGTNFSLGGDPESMLALRDQITAQLKDFGAEVIEADKARHMYAIAAVDPFPDTGEALFRSIDLLHDFDDVPSPVAPKSRRFRIAVCWQLDKSARQQWSEDVRRALLDVCSGFDKTFASKLVYDDATTGAYVLLYLDRLAAVEMEASELAAKETLNEVRPLLAQIEREFVDLMPGARRATRAFWEKEIGIFFALPKTPSDPIYH